MNFFEKGPWIPVDLAVVLAVNILAASIAYLAFMLWGS